MALSGGGFRASFFHIGVLARLAELDILRKVEVISTVSGGSIVGVLYYLHVKNLLEKRPESQIIRDDYIEIVRAIEEDFLWGAQRNVRARIFSHAGRNFVMCKPSYSRTSRIGEQLEKFFYRPVWSGSLSPKGRVRLSDLMIAPAGASSSFRPDVDNARRTNAKVPVLLINATTLNTGRNWRFEAVRMGESLPTDEQHAEIARNLNSAFFFAPGYFHERGSKPLLSGRRLEFPLGLAVAASAAVPGLFHPVAIKGLYQPTMEGKGIDVSVELVDGGVHDNQGVQGLFDRRCTRLIVSDASGQYTPLYRPASEIPAVLRRTVDLYGARLRQEQLFRGEAAAAVHPIALVHLRRGLVGQDILPQQEVVTGPRVGVTDFGINAQAQEWLAALRTDLDNFGDVEAGALMLDGYKMIDHELAADQRFETRDGAPLSMQPTEWHFGVLDEHLSGNQCPPKFERRLRVGTQRFVKPLRFFPFVEVLGWFVVGVLIGAVVSAIPIGIALAVIDPAALNPVTKRYVPEWVVVLVPASVAFVVVSYITQKPRQPTGLVISRLLPVALAPFLWVMAGIQLLFNSFYLNRASYRSVGAPQPTPYALERLAQVSPRTRPKTRF